MGLCKRAYVRGVQHEMMRRGVVSFPNAKIAEEVADAVADNLEEMPEVTGEEGLDPEESAEIMDAIVEVANEIAEKTGSAGDPELQKVASSLDYETVAHANAQALLEKAAAEYSTDVTGDAPDGENASGGMADIDAAKNPSDEIVVPQGTTHFETSQGAVGAEEPQPDPPGFAPPISNEVSKLSAWLQKMSMQGDTATGDGTPGSSTGKGDGRKDLETNVAMPKKTVVREQGTTQQKPVVPVPTKPNPAAAGVTQESKPTTDVQKEGEYDPEAIKVAQAILAHPDKEAIIKKLAADGELPDFMKKKDEGKDDEKDKEKDEEKSSDKAESKKEEAKEEEKEKEASLMDSLTRIAHANH